MIAAELMTARKAILEDMTVLADLLGRNSTAALAFHREEDTEEVKKILSAVQADHISSRVHLRQGQWALRRVCPRRREAGISRPTAR